MILQGFIISLIVLAIHSFTWDGMIFSFIKGWISSSKPISKPIYGCPICMTPWWGTIIWIIFFRSVSTVQGDSIVTVVYGLREWFLTISVATGFSVLTVIAIYIKDYCKSRTKSENECCASSILYNAEHAKESEQTTGQNINY